MYVCGKPKPHQPSLVEPKNPLKLVFCLKLIKKSMSSPAIRPKMKSLTCLTKSEAQMDEIKKMKWKQMWWKRKINFLSMVR